MPKQTFRLRKNLILNILLSFSSVALTLFGFLIVSPLISKSTHAEGDEPDDGITITVNGEVDANLVLFDEGDYKIAKDTVSVSSSAPYGYELFLTTDSEAHQSIYLNDDPTSTSKISPVSGTIDEPAALTSNTWGFAIPGQGNFDNEYDPANPDPASRFAIIPTADNQQAVFENNAATAEDNIDFYYGIKVEPTLEVGEYTTSAEYTAITKEKPFIAKAILGDNGNLNFVYDRNDYAAEDTYTDNVGETTITNVYEVPMNSTGCTTTTQMPWYDQRDSVTKANIDTSFVSARPTGTCGWLGNLRNVADITNLQNLNTSSVTDVSFMFYYAGYNATTWDIGDLSGWNTGSVTNMYNMFRNAGTKATTWDIGDLSGWNTENVTTMQSMFENAGRSATTWNIGDLSGWNTGSVTNMFGMFSYAGYNATTWDIGDLSGWNTGSVTDMAVMFRDAGNSATTWNIGDLSGWNTGSVTNMSGMFYSAGRNAATWDIGNLGGWNTGSVTIMSYMFYFAGYKTTTWDIGDLSGWNTGSVTNMSNMFASAGFSATTWDIGDLSGWNTGSVTTMQSMFQNAGYSATTWDIGNISGWNVTKVTRHTDFINLNSNGTNASVVNNQPNWN